MTISPLAVKLIEDKILQTDRQSNWTIVHHMAMRFTSGESQHQHTGISIGPINGSAKYSYLVPPQQSQLQLVNLLENLTPKEYLQLLQDIHLTGHELAVCLPQL